MIGRNFKILIITLGLLTACGQDFNSETTDAAAGGVTFPCSGNLCPAYAALVSNHCFQCHPWSTYQSDAAWISSGLVLPGNPTQSPLIQNLKNSGGTMPQTYGPLSSTDLNSLVTWIQGL